MSIRSICGTLFLIIEIVYHHQQPFWVWWSLWGIKGKQIGVSKGEAEVRAFGILHWSVRKLSPGFTPFHTLLFNPPNRSSIFSPILQMRKLRCREARYPAQSHTGSRQRSQNRTQVVWPQKLSSLSLTFAACLFFLLSLPVEWVPLIYM